MEAELRAEWPGKERTKGGAFWMERECVCVGRKRGHVSLVLLLGHEDREGMDSALMVHLRRGRAHVGVG